uniref:Uncharacterized protein n=1 Tax=Knipowitschia caucasica TaxID=637954 RepID=A0AAV2JHM4_KNICA
MLLLRMSEELSPNLTTAVAGASVQRWLCPPASLHWPGPSPSPQSPLCGSSFSRSGKLQARRHIMLSFSFFLPACSQSSAVETPSSQVR